MDWTQNACLTFQHAIGIDQYNLIIIVIIYTIIIQYPLSSLDILEIFVTPENPSKVVLVGTHHSYVQSGATLCTYEHNLAQFGLHFMHYYYLSNITK